MMPNSNCALASLQDPVWEPSLAAVKESVAFETYAEFERHLRDNLPHNSPVTRQRYTQLIQRRFFPERSLDGLVPSVWRGYRDDRILADVMRVTLLEVEPVIARFVLDYILPGPPGTTLDRNIARAYIEETYGVFKKRCYQRLTGMCVHLGLLGRYDGEWVVQALPEPADALLVLLHARLAPTPRIVRLSELLNTTWWRLLGLRAPDVVRRILRDATAAGLIARYVVVDELEQVTTRYPAADYITQGRRL